MNVPETIDLGNGHLIEIGNASWDDAQTSIRNRYPNSNGEKTSCTSEIPLTDLESIVVAVVHRDLLDVGTTVRLIEKLTVSLARRAKRTPRVSLDRLLERVTEENRHPEFDTGPAVGKEEW